jgi:hypothetical protein
MTTLVQIQTAYYSRQGLLNPGDIAGFPDADATRLIAAGIAAEYNAGDGLGVPLASPFRGQIASETNAQFVAAGGNPDNENPSAAIQGFQGNVTIVDGRAVPNSEASWA